MGRLLQQSCCQQQQQLQQARAHRWSCSSRQSKPSRAFSNPRIHQAQPVGQQLDVLPAKVAASLTWPGLQGVQCQTSKVCKLAHCSSEQSCKQPFETTETPSVVHILIHCYNAIASGCTCQLHCSCLHRVPVSMHAAVTHPAMPCCRMFCSLLLEPWSCMRSQICTPTTQLI